MPESMYSSSLRATIINMNTSDITGEELRTVLELAKKLLQDAISGGRQYSDGAYGDAVIRINGLLEMLPK